MPNFKRGRHGKIFGVEFSKAEQEAITKEIDRQWKEATVEYDRKHALEICALVLWVLYEHLGFREKRLKTTFFNFDKWIADMLKRYELDGPDDDVWLCTKKLKDAGFDIEEWAKESETMSQEARNVE